MNTSDIPYNMKFRFGPNLREVPLNNMDMLQGMVYLQEQLNTKKLNEDEERMCHGLLGFFLRIIGELTESKEHLQAAITLADTTNNQHSKFINRIRLAHTYQWENNFTVSGGMFDELMETAENNPDYSTYLDLVYEHYAKNQYDQGLFQEALNYFYKTLEIRNDKGNSELADITQKAIETTQRRLKQSSS